MRDLTQHLTTRADERAISESTCLCVPKENTVSSIVAGCQDLVRFFALRRIKPHTPLLVRAPVNSFEFQPCGRTPRWITYCVNCGTEGVYPPTPSNHRLRCGLPGYLILFATHTFEPQRQLVPSRPPSPLVFLPISTHSTATPGIPPTSALLKIPVLKAVHGLSPCISLPTCIPAALPLHPVIPDNACDLRFTAAAGT